MNLNLNEMMGKLQEMQRNMEDAREKLDQVRVEGEAGGGMVKAVANGNKRLMKITIDPEAASDREMMEDLIVAAVNKALENAEAAGKEEMSKVTGGMIPPGFDMSKFGL